MSVVLRERGKAGYELVGDAYAHGIKRGEAMTKEKLERLEEFLIH